MKSRKLWIGMLVMTLVFGMMVIGCEEEPEEPEEPTYTVWTDSVSYTEFSNVFGSLSDGYYRRMELTNSEFNQLQLTNEGKHQWTEGQIYNWFIGIGFDHSIANREKSWVITTTHGFLASRDISIVYMILF
jgi:hypothetical protein